jgi:hypothetical protein
MVSYNSATSTTLGTAQTFTFNRTTFNAAGADLWENIVQGTRTGYANEGGELRSRAYNATRTAFRCQSNVSGDNTSVSTFEVTDSTNAVVYFNVTAQGDGNVLRNLSVGGDAGVSGLAVGNLFANAWWSVPCSGSNNTSSTLAPSTAYLVPIVVDKTGSLSNVAVEIVATDTGTVRFGLASDSAGQPATWLADYGTAVATGAGVVTPTGPVSTVLTAGVRYYLGIVPQGGTGTLTIRGHSTSDPRIPNLISGASPSANVSRNCWVSTAAFAGALSGAITMASVGNGPSFFAKL